MPEGGLDTAPAVARDESVHAWLSLGANIGDRSGAIIQALRLIASTPGIRLLKTSALYATDPVGYLEQPEFINSAAAIETTLPPEELLGRLREIERKLGRVRRGRWREREIDIDIIMIGALVIRTDRLIVPHPEMHRRAFVLVPLAEIAPDELHPLLERSVSELLDDLGDTAGVRNIGAPGRAGAAAG